MRWIARIAVYLSVALLCAAAAALWWASDPRSLAWAVERLERAAQGRLEVRGATGSLLGGVHAQRAVFREEGFNLTATGLALEWSPLHLLAGRLLITRLHAARLTVDLPATPGASPTPPGPLGPPVALDIIEASIGELLISRGGEPMRFDDLSLALAGRAQSWRLQYGRAGTPWGPVQARLEVGAAPPHALKGNAEWRADIGTKAFPIRARLSGTLAEALLELKGESNGAVVTAKARLALLSDATIREIAVSAEGFDPERWLEGAPRAPLRAGLELKGAPDGSLRGQVLLENGEPGTLDRKLVPAQRATASVIASSQAIRLEDLVLDLGGAGRVTGTAVWRGGTWRLDGAAHNFDLQGVHGRLKSTALGGPISIEGDGAGQRIRAQLAQTGQTLEFDATVSPMRIDVERAVWRAGKGTLEGRGELGFTADRPFRFEGTLMRFDPSQLGDYPAARIDAELGVSGTLAPQLRAEARFRIRDSRLLEHALRGDGRFVVSARGVEQAQADLLIAGNTLAVQGGFGAPAQHLRWRVDAPRLENLDPWLAGRLRGAGHVGGTFGELEVAFELEGERLRLGGAHRVERVRATVRIEPGENGAVSGDVMLSGYSGPGVSAKDAALAVRGARHDHTVRLTASGEKIDLVTELRGGWSGGQWQGTIAQLDNRRGPFEARLERPASLAVSAERFALADVAFQLPSGRIVVAELEKRGPGLDTRGSATGLRLAWLLERAGLRTEPFRTDLRLGVEWSLRFQQALNGTLKVWRESGTFVIDAQPPVPLQAQRFEVDARIVENRLSLDVAIDAGRALRLEARAASELERRRGRWGVAGSAPLAASGTLSADSLEWAGLLAPLPGLSTGGALQAEFDASGTVSAPALSGRMTARGLRILWPEQGLDLAEGELAATFQGAEVALERLALRGADGRLEATGTASVGADPRLSLKATASRLPLISRPDRLLVVSGEADFVLQGGRMQATGRLRADRGLIELPERTVTVSEDVVVLGPQSKPPAQQARLPLHAELEFDFGPDFALRGRGIDARLGGVLRLIAADAKPVSAHGNVRVVRGTYRAYGQNLVIERGVFNFNGPLDDPRLDVLALRKGLQVEAGVEIVGTVQAPRIRLVSTPVVSDAEKLSWLALGHGLDRSSRAEITVLAGAANALLASDNAASLQSQLAQAGGLDEVSIGGEGGLEDTVVTLGKRISSNVYVSYEQGIANATNAFKVHYELTRRWSVRAQTGTANAVDLFYSLRFD